MPRLIESIRLAYPLIEFQISFNDALENVMGGDSDLGICISEPPQDKSTIWRKLCGVPRYAAAAPRLFERFQRPSTPGDLDPALCLAYAQ